MELFAEAIAFAQAHEVPWPRDPAEDPARWGVHHEDPPPFNRLRGPVHARGGVNGLVRIGGKEVVSWGDPSRADLTFSVAKTYLAILAGIAHARGLIADAEERVSQRLPGIGFDDEHNRTITWSHLLSQTSEWGGTCFGMPDTVEHNRKVSLDPKPPQGAKGEPRALQAPGTYWEYNDVRINQLSLALLHLFRAPLPKVFEEEVLRPIGASLQWRWAGYDDAWVQIDGKPMQSVPGGSHWGGGVSISARDQSLIAQLLLDGRVHAGREIVPREWVQRMRQPCAIAPFYGWLTWVNHEGRLFPEASHASWFMWGAGGHYVWMEPEREAVVVVRWLDPMRIGGFVARMANGLAAL